MARNGTAFEFVAAPKTAPANAVLVVPLLHKPQPAMELLSHIDTLCADGCSRLVSAKALGADAGALTPSVTSGKHRRLLVVSLGDAAALAPHLVRKAADKVARWLISEKATQATLCLDGLRSSGVDDAAAEFAMGCGLAGYRYEEFKIDKDRPAKIRIAVRAREAAHVRQVLPQMKTALQTAEGVNYLRLLAQSPANVINPKTLAAEGRKLATKHPKIKCTVLEPAKLRQLNMNGLLAVGRGAAEPSRLIRLDYKGAPGARTNTVLVGKAITYDSGGYCLKQPAGHIDGKYDKTGGCTVMGVLKAAALLKLKCNLVGLVAAAENMVSHDAYRAGDIIRMANGKTVKITNTDAEGRMVLADALWYAQKHCKPTALIDMATLTGGVGVALGSVCAGLMGNDDSLAADLEESGRRTHERLWQLPLWDDYRELMKHDEADLVNSSAKRDAHCIQGGIFLKEFIEPQTSWAHLDIAAVAVDESAGVRQATGFGVRLLVDYLQRRSG